MKDLLLQLSTPVRQALLPYEKELAFSREIRIRIHRPMQLCGAKNIVIPEFQPDRREMEELMLCLCDQAMYAHESQLAQGYITLHGGHRAGVCGRMVCRDGKAVRMSDIQSVSIRIARQMPCEARILDTVRSAERLRSCLVVSSPGMGKTTLLRDLARRLSEEGVQVAIADERGELAACREGVPQLDVGPCTDVMDGMPKAESIALMLRAMSPQMIVCDEIGSEADVRAILDAQRCGVQVLCSAHGTSIQDVKSRPSLRMLLGERVFDRILLLGQRVGHVQAVYDRDGRPC